MGQAAKKSLDDGTAGTAPGEETTRQRRGTPRRLGGTWTSTQKSAAYFDVDGTITPLTTMFELLLFDARLVGRLEDGVAFLARLKAMKLNGALRDVTNREYFRWWTELLRISRTVGPLKMGRY